MTHLFSKKTHTFQILLLFFIINAPFSVAQNICGKIVNAERQPVEYVNIAILNPSDSSWIDGTIGSGQGEFCFQNSPRLAQIMKISCIGYITKYLDIKIKDESVHLGEITLEPDVTLLKEVTITTSMPPFSIKGNRLIANVSSSLLALSGTANDVIEQIPGIIIKDKAITVFGHGSPDIFIDNRKIYDQDELQRLKSTDIKTVELIKNAGTKYDAEKQTVLLIKTKQSEENGWAIQVSETLRKGTYWGDGEDVKLSYTYNQFSLFTSLHHESHNDLFRNYASYTIHSDTLWHQLIDMPQTHKGYNNHITLGADWSITEKQAIGMQYQTSLGNNKIIANGIESILMNGSAYDHIYTTFNAKNKQEQHLVNAFYLGNYTESFLLRYDMDFVSTNNRTMQETKETSSIENRNVSISSWSKNHLFAGKITMEYKINENNKIEFGGEYNQINSSGALANPEQYVKNNAYVNEEQKTAGFVSYSGISGNLNYSSGIRYEFTHLLFTENAQKRLAGNYSRFYPYFSISKPVGNTQMGIELSRKIQRPAFSLLSADSYYINRFLFEKGNPYLKAEDIYKADYHLSYRMFNLDLGYVFKKDAIGLTWEKVENQSSQSMMTYINYPDYQEFNLLASANFKYKIWKPRISFGLNQPFFAVNYLGYKVKKNQTGILLQFFNNIEFPGKYIFSANFEYMGKHNEYIGEIPGYKSLNPGIQKSFLNDQLSVQLKITDIFRWINSRAIIKINNISFMKNSEYETRYFIFTVNYHFHNYKKKYRGKNAAEDDIIRI
jgi:hypothetical protein